MFKRVVYVCLRSDMSEDYPVIVKVLENEVPARLWKSEDSNNRDVQEWIVEI